MEYKWYDPEHVTVSQEWELKTENILFSLFVREHYIFY